jgi:uncharacterized membrane protein YheB (UPF0754 family)
MALAFYKLYWLHLAHTCLNVPEAGGEFGALLPFFLVNSSVSATVTYLLFRYKRKMRLRKLLHSLCFQMWEIRVCAARTPHFLMYRDVRK